MICFLILLPHPPTSDHAVRQIWVHHFALVGESLESQKDETGCFGLS